MSFGDFSEPAEEDVDEWKWCADDWEALRRYKVAMLTRAQGGTVQQEIKNVHVIAVELVKADVREKAAERQRMRCQPEYRGGVL